jgi:hypothetical protein
LFSVVRGHLTVGMARSNSAIRDLEALRPVLPASACWPTNDPPDTLIDR